MKSKLLIISLVALCFCCNNKKIVKGYFVNGFAKNIPDSTKVVMYFNNDSIMGSTYVFNEKFQFKGSVDRPRRVMLRMESIREGKMFWLENKQIDVAGKKDDFSNAEVSGSKTQEESIILRERKDYVFKKMDSISGLVNDANRDSLYVIYDEMVNEEIKINKNFIKDYPSSYESLTVLNVGTKERLGPQETVELFNLLSKELQDTEEGNAILHFIEINKNPKIGDKFADFEQKSFTGESIRFSEVMGRYTLLEFWASWCGPCRASNPELVEAYKKYKDKGFAIVGVSLDTNKEKWIKAIEKDSLVWYNVSDLKGVNNEVGIIYGIDGVPDNFLIDNKGTVIARYLRGENLKGKLKALFGE